MKDTITGFAQRYTEFIKKTDETFNESIVTFSIVTNRAIAENFRRNLDTIASGGIANIQFQATLEKYTKLGGKDLTEFCALIKFVGGEGDYDDQRYELHAEMLQLLAGTVDSPEVDNIVALVQGKALPNSDGVIRREDILKRFGVTSERDLYPAPLELESLGHFTPQKQHETMLDYIVKASAPVIIHAAGGVGKSVFARQIAEFYQQVHWGSYTIVSGADDTEIEVNRVIDIVTRSSRFQMNLPLKGYVVRSFQDLPTKT